jgi:hypothetical protein
MTLFSGLSEIAQVTVAFSCPCHTRDRRNAHAGPASQDLGGWGAAAILHTPFFLDGNKELLGTGSCWPQSTATVLIHSPNHWALRAQLPKWALGSGQAGYVDQLKK